MSKLKIEIPEKIADIFDGDARYRIAYGGRGSGKSWSFAAMLIAKALQKKRRILCARELQKSIKDSSHKLIADTIERLGVKDQFEVGESFIRCKNGSDFIFMGLKHNADQIKSTEGIDICWVEEAHRITKKSLDLLMPTIRKEGSEIWFTFNPDNEEDEIYQRFIMNEPPARTKIGLINWYDNPWFTDELNEERLYTKKYDNDNYAHIWEGTLNKALEGRYYARQLKELDDKDKIIDFPLLPEYPITTFWDIGRTDYTTIWFMQKVAGEYRLVDYWYMADGDVDIFARTLMEKGYRYECHVLPHDAGQLRVGMAGKTVKQQMETALPSEKFKITKVTKSVQADIMATRMFLLRCAFHKTNCEEGLQALRNYRKKWNDEKNMYEDKPLHDWSSHGADAFRELAIYCMGEEGIERPVKTATGIPTFNSLIAGSKGSSRI